MHRSGTSALTRLISLCGAALPQNLLAAVEDDNETGFWESAPLTDLDDELLTAAGRVWHDLRPIPPAWFAQPAAAALVVKLAAMIEAEFGAAELLAIKDPRVCRLLPLYRAALERAGIRPVAVIPVRNPLEVAASMRLRNGIGESKGVLLWLEHVLAAERYSRGMRRCFSTFGQALDDPAGLMGRVGVELGVVWPRPPAVVAAEMAAFLTPGLRHQKCDDGELFDNPDVPDEVKQVYAWMNEAAGAGTRPEVAVLDEIAARLKRSGGLYHAANAELEAEARRQEATLKHWVDAAVERYGMIEHLQREITRLEAAANQPCWRKLLGSGASRPRRG